MKLMKNDENKAGQGHRGKKSTSTNAVTQIDT